MGLKQVHLVVRGRVQGVYFRASTQREARRLGLARRILGALEEAAAARGCTVVRLDTHASLTEAQAMSRACGYTEIPAYVDHVYADHWFEKRLSGRTA